MKKIISVLLAFVMLFGVTLSMGVTVFAEDETSNEPSYSGKCGENVYYNFDESTATLTISGTGDMADYAGAGYQPWSNYEEYISSVIIENGVTSIGDYAFSNCNLTSVTIPDGVTSIGRGAFSSCKFTSVKIPDSVISIKEYAFVACNYLTSVMLPKNIKSLGTSISETPYEFGVFDFCNNLNDISVSSENKYYSSQEGVLFDKNKTELICYPAGKAQTEYIVPNGVTEIGVKAFLQCNLENIVLPESLKSIGVAVFQGCDITNITIPASVTSIGWGSFYQCHRLTDISVSPENNNYSSQDGVLFNKDKTKLIRYPAGKTQEKYVIPNGVKSFDNDTFNNCYRLESITIPDSLLKIITQGPFLFCDNLTEIIVSPGNKYYSSQDGVLFDKNKTALICYPANKSETEYTVPNGVKKIWRDAFEDCNNLVNVTISDSVTSIEGYAFVNSRLKNIKMFNSVISIGEHAFANCWKLENVIMSNNITSLGEGAFCQSGSLKSVTIPNNITTIERNTFLECESLTSITISNTVKSVGNYAFDKCLNLSDVYYTGTEEQWNKIQIGSNNECLTNANIHFQSKDPTTAPGGSMDSGTSGSGSSDGGSSNGSSGGGAPGAAPTIPEEKPNETPETKPITPPIAPYSKPAQVAVNKPQAKEKAVVVIWKKVKNVSGYEIQLATDKKFKKNKKKVNIKKPNASKKTIKELKKNKKYYVRVRSYKIINDKKVYGKWSKVKSVKTK